MGLYVLPIRDDIITLSKKNDLSDIKLIDLQNNDIPYVLIKSNLKKPIVKNKIEPVFLENTATKDNKRIVVLDTGREGLIYNTLVLKHATSSINFKKTAKVYISDSLLKSNSTGWKELELKSGIYNYTKDGLTLENLDVSLSGLSSRYIKVELIGDTPILIESAAIEYSQNEETEKQFDVKEYVAGDFTFNNSAIYKNVKVDSKTQKERVSEIVYPGGIDVEELTIEVDSNDENFNRKVEVQGSNNDLDWVPLISSSIYRVDSPIYSGEKLNIAIQPASYKKLKVIIFNENEKPLDISKNAKIKLQNVGLLFKTDMNISDVRILVGNNKDMGSEYDTKAIESAQQAMPQLVTYKNIGKNPEYVPDIIPFAERKKVMLNIALLLFVVIVGIFGFFWMKNTHHE